MPRRTALPFLACAVSLLAPSLIAQPSPSVRVPLAEPAVSPDGATIVFASGGDLWTVPASGGDAHLLVSDPATESRPH